MVEQFSLLYLYGSHDAGNYYSSVSYRSALLQYVKSCVNLTVILEYIITFNLLYLPTSYISSILIPALYAGTCHINIQLEEESLVLVSIIFILNLSSLFYQVLIFCRHHE